MKEFYWFAGIVVVCVAGAWLAVHLWEGGPADQQTSAADDDGGDRGPGGSEFERAFREQECAARAQEGYDSSGLRN